MQVIPTECVWRGWGGKHRIMSWKDVKKNDLQSHKCLTNKTFTRMAQCNSAAKKWLTQSLIVEEQGNRESASDFCSLYGIDQTDTSMINPVTVFIVQKGINKNWSE